MKHILETWTFINSPRFYFSQSLPISKTATPSSRTRSSIVYRMRRNGLGRKTSRWIQIRPPYNKLRSQISHLTLPTRFVCLPRTGRISSNTGRPWWRELPKGVIATIRSHFGSRIVPPFSAKTVGVRGWRRGASGPPWIWVTIFGGRR